MVDLLSYKYFVMQTEFSPLRSGVYQLKLHIPYTNDQIVQELSRESWIADQAGYGQNSFETRYRCPNPTNVALTEVSNYVETGNFKQQVIKALYSDPLFAGNWGLTPEKMDQTTHLYALYTWDRPGYSIRIHTDDRMHVAQGMIYFIDGDDPEQSTYFYDNKNGDNPVRVPTGHAQGFVGANLNNGWHTGQNTSNRERYSLMFGLRLKQFHL